jgi:pimeloyl-ACP methyl ester carboxylesterase
MNTRNNPVTKRRGCLGCLGRGLIGLLALLVIVMIVGAIYQSAASASDLKKYPPPGQLYDVGEHRLHLNCIGKGSPTVILEAGGGSPGRVWHLVQEKVAEFTRVCSYDRPGFGWSDPASGPLSSEQMADILHQLLETANVPGPYVMVGHSAGGVLIREFTQKYPSEVIGMVLVDSSHESQNLRFPPEYLDSAKQKVMMYKACQALTPFGIMRMARLWHRMDASRIRDINRCGQGSPFHNVSLRGVLRGKCERGNQFC